MAHQDELGLIMTLEQGKRPGGAEVDIGPLIDRQALEDVASLVRDSVAAGAEVLLGGRPHGLRGCSTSRPS